MHSFRFWLLGIVIAAALVPGAPAIQAQTEGPLKVKIPPRRPPRAEPRAERRPEPRAEPPAGESGDEDFERPVLKRKGETPETDVPYGASSGDSPCPAGYIGVPVTREEAEERPRLVRAGSEAPDPDEPGEENEVEYECVFSEVVPGGDDETVERRRPPASGDAFIESVREKVFEFSSKLPNFLCEQMTSRSSSSSNPARWRVRDRITADVVYEDGKERYENIRRNGKKMKGDPTKSGAWSTGEFGTVMLDVFHPSTSAKFKFVRDSEIAGTTTKVYDYTVKQSNSHWRVEFDGHELYPAYEGSVWIDPRSFRVLRIEMAAVELPFDYPVDTIETSVDYGPVKIDGKEYLLVSRSANLSCQRGTRNCSRNVIEFRNYRKFEVESSISTTDSSITFEGEPQLAEPPKPEP